LELDELWTFVAQKRQKVWIWLALERATHRIVGVAFGDRSTKTCEALWQSLPPDYRKRAVLYTDQWKPYREVLPSKRHRIQPAGTNRIEGFNAKLRAHCANLVRKTLSFSKRLDFHFLRIRAFIDHHNRSLSV
jgi:insertion element IS1 protein InsB